jgi:hypothetical protein
MYRKKLTNEREGKPDQKFDAAFGKSLESVSVLNCFQRSKQELYIHFSREQGRLNI